MPLSGLLERNPASHLVWWVGGVALVLIGVLIAVDLFLDWRHSRGTGSVEESEDPRLRLPPKQSWLRQRHLRRITSSWRTFRSGWINRDDP